MNKEQVKATTSWLKQFQIIMDAMPNTLRIGGMGEIRLNLSETNETCIIVNNKDAGKIIKL